FAQCAYSNRLGRPIVLLLQLCTVPKLAQVSNWLTGQAVDAVISDSLARASPAVFFPRPRWLLVCPHGPFRFNGSRRGRGGAGRWRRRRRSSGSSPPRRTSARGASR